MPKRFVAVSLMALAIASVHHKPAEAAPLSSRGAVAATERMVEPVGDCRDCYRERIAGRSYSDGRYRGRPKVQGWSRRNSYQLYRPRAASSARWAPEYRYGAASWSDQRAWTYYGQW